MRMLQRINQKILFRILSLTVVIFGLSKLVQYTEEKLLHLLHRELYNCYKQPSGVLVASNDNLLLIKEVNSQHTSPEEVQQYDKQQQQPLPVAEEIVKIDQHLINLTMNHFKFSNFIRHLSSSQVADLVRKMAVSNLTSRKVQEKYLKCGGILTLRKLKHPQPEAPIPVIPTHQQCKNMSFKRSGPIVALASFPGSGNSWVRQLLESATGIYTGAVWCDISYINAGMIGEGVDTNNVLAVKIHYYNPSDTKIVLNNDKAIYIVRSPFAAMLSENNRNVAKKHMSLKESHVVEVDFNYSDNPAWEIKVKANSRAWRSEVKQWLNYARYPILIVGYENLKKDTYTQLRKMLDFLEYPYSEDGILCAVKNSGGSFHRKHTRKDLHPFSPELQKFVLNEIKQVDADLLKHNISLYHPYSEN